MIPTSETTGKLFYQREEQRKKERIRKMNRSSEKCGKPFGKSTYTQCEYQKERRVRKEQKKNIQRHNG